MIHHYFYESKLEKIAQQYDIEITFTPKFYCELNSIEGLWAHQKQFIRKQTDQTFPTMINLIANSRINFVKKNVAIKLFRRFWHTLVAYDRGDAYEEVLTMYFSSLCRGTIRQHRQITNSNIG